MSRLLPAAALSALALAVQGAAAASLEPPHYAIRRLVSAHGELVAGNAITSGGVVVGAVDGRPAARAEAWLTPARPVEIPADGGLLTPYGVNDAGLVVGVRSVDGNGAGEAWLVDRAGTGYGLGAFLPGQATYSVASAVDAAGQVVGRFGLPGGVAHGFLWSAAGGLLDLGAMSPSGINAAGQVSCVLGGPGETRACLWSAATGIVDLAPVLPPGLVASRAVAIDAQGRIAIDAIDDRTGFVYDSHAGRLTPLPDPFSGSLDGLHGMNDAGVITGSATYNERRCPDTVGHECATVWYPSGNTWAAFDLNRLVDWGDLAPETLAVAGPVNAAGQIVASTQRVGHTVHAYLLTPTP